MTLHMSKITLHISGSIHVFIYISVNIHHMILIVVHNCKMIISPGVFFIFSSFWFFGLLGESKGKKWPKLTKWWTSYDVGFRYIWWYLQQFFSFFQNSDFFGFSGVEGEKWPIITNFSLSHSMYQELYIISSIFLVNMCKIMVSPGVFLYFLKKMHYCKY